MPKDEDVLQLVSVRFSIFANFVTLSVSDTHSYPHIYLVVLRSACHTLVFYFKIWEF